GMSGVVLLRDVVPELEPGALVGVVPPDEGHGLGAVLRARGRERARHEHGDARDDDPGDCERLPASHELDSSLHGPCRSPLTGMPEVAWCPELISECGGAVRALGANRCQTPPCDVTERRAASGRCLTPVVQRSGRDSEMSASSRRESDRVENVLSTV